MSATGGGRDEEGSGASKKKDLDLDDENEDEQRKRSRSCSSSVIVVPIIEEALASRTLRGQNKRAKTMPAATATSSSSSSKWELTPVSILLRTLGYMDNDTLMIMCLVCKQIKELIWNGQGMENKLIRVFDLRPLPASHDDNVRMWRLLSNMEKYVTDDNKSRMLQGYQHWDIHDPYRFYNKIIFEDDDLKDFTLNIRMNGILSLKAALPVSPLEHSELSPWSFMSIVAFMVPNLQQLDFSNLGMNTDILEQFSVRSPRLEIVQWNNSVHSRYGDGISADGANLSEMQYLKELYLDECHLEFDHAGNPGVDEHNNFIMGVDINTSSKAMADMEESPNIFLFHKLVCNTTQLQRLSIRNVAASVQLDQEFVTIYRPQKILMKFVRNAPSTLVWFRSDLSAANIKMLQLEKPNIEFVN